MAGSDGGLRAEPAGLPAPVAHASARLVPANGWREAYFWAYSRESTARVGLERLEPLEVPAAFATGRSYSVPGVNPAGTELAVQRGWPDPAVAVWDTVAGRVVRTLAVAEGATGAALGGSGHALVGGASGWAHLFDPAGTRAARVRVGNTGSARAAFSPAGPLLATFALGKTLKLWHRDTGEPRGVFDWRLGKVTHAAFSPDGLTLAVGGDKRAHVVVFDLDA